MEITIQNCTEGILAIFNGSLDTHASASVEPQIRELEGKAFFPITIDCTGLDYISSSGLRLLLRIRKAASAQDTMVTLLNVNDNIMEVLAITHFDKMFIIK